MAGQKLRIKPVIDHIVHQPLLCIRKNMVVDLAVGFLKMFQLAVSVHRVRDADLVDQLIDIEKRKGQGGLPDIPFAQLCPPGEVSAQLLVRQRLIGGVIVLDAAAVIIIILITRQQLGLFQENGFPGLPVLMDSVFQ